MSNRFERGADKKLVEKHQRILKALSMQPENRICADCKKRDPRWASANLGVFVCLRCSGIHRSLGTHISKVRSIDLDTWIPEHIEVMQRWGNDTANKYWEHALPPGHVPDDSKMESFIRTKYEYKKFALSPNIPEPETLKGDAPPPVVVQQQQTPATQNQSSQFSSKPQPQSNDPFSSSAFVNPAPVRAPQPAPVVAAVAAKAPVFDTGFDDFGSFASAPAVASNTSAPAVKPTPAPANNLKANILSLYGTSGNGMQTTPQMQGMAPQVGHPSMAHTVMPPYQQQQQQPFGNMNMHQMPAQQQQQNFMQQQQQQFSQQQQYHHQSLNPPPNSNNFGVLFQPQLQVPPQNQMNPNQRFQPTAMPGMNGSMQQPPNQFSVFQSGGMNQMQPPSTANTAQYRNPTVATSPNQVWGEFQ